MPGSIAYWFFRLTSAARWYLNARTRYDVHSPRLNEFIREVYRDRRYYHAFTKIAKLRKFWKTQGRQVKLQSLGAASKTTSRDRRSAASLVATNAIADGSGRFLFRLALWLQAKHILEFGTNAGISTLYLQEADTRAKISTVEGNPEVAALARETFRRAGYDLLPFEDRFDRWLQRHPPSVDEPYDLVFIDGDHRYQPTLDYIAALLPARTSRSVFVVADIHWSADMERAWADLQRLPEITASIDTYHFGLLFFDPALTGPHLALIPTRYKPWRLGFF